MVIFPFNYAYKSCLYSHQAKVTWAVTCCPSCLMKHSGFLLECKFKICYLKIRKKERLGVWEKGRGREAGMKGPPLCSYKSIYKLHWII